MVLSFWEDCNILKRRYCRLSRSADEQEEGHEYFRKYSDMYLHNHAEGNEKSQIAYFWTDKP
jgi:hypothetical protein